ncbi:hypothetical protein PsYK624_128310 [Phanerochaete sordida]|uniref:F-box domain-containing protein n=1 Tax=Phanerochaete sordida TaxID=48140 RepID=A0A9P3GKX5_9APHY|nr:hypothetical protein PsYK624_128310 [Phanerochaete sordida]
MAGDEVCVLCGIRPDGGPTWLCDSPKRHAALIAREICDAGAVDLAYDDVRATLANALSIHYLNAFPGDPRLAVEPDPDGDTDCIAIGYFGANGRYRPCTHHVGERHPPGDDVAVRRVSQCIGGATFGLVVRFVDGVRQEAVAKSQCGTGAGIGACNVWAHANCYAYLEAWLDCASAPRMGRMLPIRALSLASELYEICASREETRAPDRGHMPCIDYGGTLDAFMDITYQDYILGCRQGSRSIVQALRAGLRDEELVSAIAGDCRLWMFVRPDIWPLATPDAIFSDMAISSDFAPQPQSLFAAIPLELLPLLLQHLDLQDIFALAYTCKALSAGILDRATLAHTLRLAMSNLRSSLHWLPPVPSLREEWDAACEAMCTWLPPAALAGFISETKLELDTQQQPADGQTGNMADADESLLSTSTTPLPTLPLLHPAFPVVPFLRACAQSVSMRARRRRWQIIKQWDVLFADYRTKGYQNNRFCHDGCLHLE